MTQTAITHRHTKRTSTKKSHSVFHETTTENSTALAEDENFEHHGSQSTQRIPAIVDVRHRNLKFHYEIQHVTRSMKQIQRQKVRFWRGNLRLRR